MSTFRRRLIRHEAERRQSSQVEALPMCEGLYFRAATLRSDY